MCKGEIFECELATMLENLTENRPLYKDSGLWQIKDEAGKTIYEQDVNESLFDFVKRAYDEKNSFMDLVNF